MHARLFAASSDHSGDWLHVLTIAACSLHSHIDNETIRVAVGLRLGCLWVPCTLCEIACHMLADRLQCCVGAIGDWCASRRLQLNPSKTEMTWFVSLASLRKIAANDLSLRVGSDVITSVDAVRDLGATLDSQLTMQQHVNKVASACFFRSDV